MQPLIKFKNLFVNPKRIDYIEKLGNEGFYRILLSVGGNCFYEIHNSKEDQETRFQELKYQIENA